MVTVVRSFTLVTGAVLLLGLPLPALAQASRPDTSIKRLGGPTRMTSPLRDTDQLARAFGSTRTQNDLRAVMDEAGLSALTDQVQAAIANGRVREVTVAPGTRFEWMAFRRGGRARVVQGPRWDGARPFAAYEFEIDDRKNTYTFLVPEDCGNLTLAKLEPSREQARLDEDAKRKAAEAASAAEAARADDARRAEEARRADEARRAEEARKAEAARVEEARRAEEARKAEEARQAEEARLAEEAALAWRPFVAGYFGKQRRQYDANDPANLGTEAWPGFCDPLIGGKVGMEYRLGDNGWVLGPAVGVAYNTDESDRTSLFVDAEINRRFASRAYVGAGLGLWDLTHSDFLTPTALLHFGLPLWRGDDQRTLFFVTEGRLFLRRASDLDSNYQFWGGLRFLFR